MPATVSQPERLPELDEPVASNKASYVEILKSTALVGGSSALNIGIGIVRTKAMAILLGPAGFGLMGLYSSIIDLAQSVAGMGVNSSGVRQIAEAAGSDDRERIARTATVLRHVSVVLGLIGALVLIVASSQASILTFGSKERAGGVALLSIAVFLRVASGGQGALIQGMRHIASFAKMNVLGAALGTLATIPIVYFYREQGVVPSLIVVTAATLMLSWWYTRDIDLPAIKVSASQLWSESAALLKLGFVFMASGLMMMGSAYAVRTIILHKLGIESTGLYQSAWTLGGLYVGFILQAMGADFYPRLTAVARDNLACNRLVNEQARVGMLLAGPGIVGTLAFAPIVIALFYSASFYGAVGTVRWICLGIALRVIMWPAGYIIVARGEQGIFFWTEVAWTVMNVSLTWKCIDYFGVTGAGVAFFASYVLHGGLIYYFVRRLSGFRWSSESWATAYVFVSAIVLVFGCLYYLPFRVALTLAALMLVGYTAFSVRCLASLVDADQIPRPLHQILLRVQRRA
jgi:enterobacterial common antigen flippase